MNRKRPALKILMRQFLIAVGVLLIWRSLWHALDYVDIHVFQGNGAVTIIGGLILGIMILYLPDHDLKELGKL